MESAEKTKSTWKQKLASSIVTRSKSDVLVNESADPVLLKILVIRLTQLYRKCPIQQVKKLLPIVGMDSIQSLLGSFRLAGVDKYTNY